MTLPENPMYIHGKDGSKLNLSKKNPTPEFLEWLCFSLPQTFLLMIRISVLLTLSWIFTASMLSAQVTVNWDNQVFIGDTSNVAGFLGKHNVMTIEKSKTYGFLNYARRFDSYNSDGVNYRAFFNVMDSDGVTPGDSSRTGIQNLLLSNTNMYFNNGIYNYMSVKDYSGNPGRPDNIGIVNRSTDVEGKLSGFKNDLHPIRSEIRGFHNYIEQTQDRRVHGLFNHLVVDRDTSPVFGVYNQFIARFGYGSNAKKYGVYTEFIEQGVTNSTGDKYGLYSYISTGGTGKKYGIYSRVDVTDTTKHFAGYFKGKVLIEGTLQVTSDIKLKDNIVDLNDALSLIKKLNPKSYELKEEKRLQKSTKKHFGFIAQEVQAVAPDLVSTAILPGEPFTKEKNSKGKDLTYESDGKGNLKEKMSDITNTSYETYVGPDQEVKSVNYLEFIPILIQGIKEQQATIETLQKEIEELKKKVK